MSLETDRLLAPTTETQYLKDLAKFLDKIIAYDEWTNTLNKIQSFHELCNQTNSCHSFYLAGESGAGKTAILQYYASQAKIVSRRRKPPVITVTIPPKCTPRSLASNILEECEDFHSRRGTAAMMTQRLADIVESHKIELIILDEFQHFINKDNDKILYDSADWLKTFMNKTKASFILAGLPWMTRIFAANKQLERRNLDSVILKPFSIQNRVEVKRLQMFLAFAVESLRFIDKSVFFEAPCLKAIVFSTDGYIAQIKRLIYLSALNAFQRRSYNLELEDLICGYERVILQKEEQQINPFLHLQKIDELLAEKSKNKLLAESQGSKQLFSKRN